MLAVAFSVLCLLSFVGAALCGNLAALSDAIIDGAGRAVTLAISLCGMMCLWNGIMEVLRRCGAIEKLSRLLAPVLRFAFPAAAKNPAAMEAISSNLCANLIGIGNAATPFALRAMQELQRENPDPDSATDDMVTLAVLNSSSVNLVPTTIMTLRRAAGSAAVAAVVAPIRAVSILCSLAAVLLCRAFARVGRKSKVGVRLLPSAERRSAS